MTTWGKWLFAFAALCLIGTVTILLFGDTSLHDWAKSLGGLAVGTILGGSSRTRTDEAAKPPSAPPSAGTGGGSRPGGGGVEVLGEAVIRKRVAVSPVAIHLATVNDPSRLRTSLKVLMVAFVLASSGMALVVHSAGCSPRTRAEIVSGALADLARAACRPALDRCKAANLNPCAELTACQAKRRQAFSLMREVVK
ncbi:MAG: hypothetical protein KC503_17470 [Myxococcales bacterium]|nr:hypothetical protein [Myxococcales bacterium]